MSFLNRSNSGKLLTARARIRGAVYAAVLLLGTTLLFLFLLSMADRQIYRHMDADQFDELAGMEREISSQLYNVGTDLTYLSRNALTRDFLISRESGKREDLISFLELIAESGDYRYDQIRILDESGMEKLRLNYRKGIQIVPDSQLQDKSQRYYVQEAFNLGVNQTYISPFDLNVEEGKVEIPRKPIIRYAQQIYDETGSVIGIGILNFLGNRILQSLKEMNEHDGDEIYLINDDGHYLIGRDSSSEWGWMFPGIDIPTFQDEYPHVARRMTHDSGTVLTEKGKFYYSTVSTKSHHCLSGERLVLIMRVPHFRIEEIKSGVYRPFKLGFFLITPLMLFLGFHLGSYQVRQRWLFERLEEEATHDMLTGLYNRRAVMDRLYDDMRLTWRRKSSLTVAFIDVNDLKVLNDSKGHDAGDILIKGAADALAELIRGTDYAARVGGDEFLVVFHDCTRDDAEQIMERIQNLFNTRGEESMHMPWSMSWGCASLRVEDSVEDLVVRADARMYDYKAAQKAEKGETPH